MTYKSDIPDAIDGGTVMLRPLAAGDRTLIHRWLNDPAVMAFWGGVDQPLTRAESGAWMTRFLEGGPGCRCLVIETTDRAIGFIELSRPVNDRNYGHVAEIDICIGESSEWEKGYGSAALRALLRWLFTQTSCERAFLQPRETNERAVHAYEKVGFRREGLLRRAFYQEGTYHDAVMMAALRDEWLAGPGTAHE